MNILFGLPDWPDWQNNLKKLPYQIHFKAFNHLDNIEQFIDYIDQNKIDVIIPITYLQMYFVIKYHGQLISKVKEIICGKNIELIFMLDNKYEFYKEFSQYVPQVYMAQISGKKHFCHTPKYPCIYKLTKSYGGIGSFIINNEKELEKLDVSENYIIQEYISSPYEYSAHFYVVDGNIKFFICYMQTNHAKNYIQHGRLLNYVRMTDVVWIDTFIEIFKKINYTGFACIDFKVIDNKPIIFEINPRLGGSIVCTNYEDLERIIDVAITNSKECTFV